MLLLKPFTEDHGWSALGASQVACAYGFATHRLAYMLDSLVRVSRRVGWKPSASVLGNYSLGPPGAMYRDKADDSRARQTHADQPPALRGGSLSRIKPGGTRSFQTLPPQQFQALFNSLFKGLFIFPSQYLFAIGLSPVFSLRWNLPPALGCSPKQPDSAKTPRDSPARGPTGLSPSRASHSWELGAGAGQRSPL